jgi:hypothetical protein
MKRLVFVLAALMLTLPTVAFAKGPSDASVNGPGTGGGLKINGDGESAGTQLGNLTEQAGFFPATFGQQPDPMLQARPKGDLGPKYRIKYTVPGPDNKTFYIEQDLYPYANPPVTYTAPGQAIFYGTSRGGWYVAPQDLKNTLVSAGLPKAAPSGSSSGSSFFSGGLISLLAAALLLVTGTAVILARRARPAATA